MVSCGRDSARPKEFRGLREFFVADPDGYVCRFFEHIDERAV